MQSTSLSLHSEGGNDKYQPDSMPLFGTERRDEATNKVNELSSLL